jgi:chromosome segregation ATPase
MNDEYLTIAAFAAKAGVTKQAIYKRLNNQLSKYLKVVDNHKYIHISALELYNKQTEEPTVDQPNQPKVDQVKQQLNDLLKEELTQKNRQIEELNKQIAELHQLLNQAQQLQLTVKKENEKLIDTVALLQAEQQQSNNDSSSAPQTTKKRWSLWRIFKQEK